MTKLEDMSIQELYGLYVYHMDMMNAAFDAMLEKKHENLEEAYEAAKSLERLMGEHLQ